MACGCDNFLSKKACIYSPCATHTEIQMSFVLFLMYSISLWISDKQNMAESGPKACWMQYFTRILPEEHQLSPVTPEANLLHYSMPFSGEHTSLFHLLPYWTLLLLVAGVPLSGISCPFSLHSI